MNELRYTFIYSPVKLAELRSLKIWMTMDDKGKAASYLNCMTGSLND